MMEEILTYSILILIIEYTFFFFLLNFLGGARARVPYSTSRHWLQLLRRRRLPLLWRSDVKVGHYGGNVVTSRAAIFFNLGTRRRWR